MLDATAPHTRLQRAQGRAAVAIGPAGRIEGLRQQGCAKVMLPKMHGRPPEAVFLNTAGGVTAGDRLHYAFDVAPGASAVGTTQTAERAYRAKGGHARIETRLSVGAGGRLAWLPQEMILFDGAQLERHLTVDMADDAELVLLETLVLGRVAMGERVARLTLTDRREVRRGGRLAMVEPIEILDADLAARGPAGLGGAVALASLSVLAPDAEDRLETLRAVLPDGGPVRAAASAWDGRLTARFTAEDAFPLRRLVACAVQTLTRAPLPRVWQI